MKKKLNGYVCFYKGKRYEVQANSSYAAQLHLAEQLRVQKNKSYLINVVLAEINNKQYTHTATD